MPRRWKWLEYVARLTHVMMKELIAHESCDQGGEDEDKTWLDGLVARVKGKLRTWCQWTEAMVKSK